jgi:hypothetical protein
VPDADTYRRLSAALEEIELWARIAPLLPFAVHHDHEAERERERQRRLAMIPSPRRPVEQRRPVDLWPVPRSGDPRRQIQLPRRMQ